jgi:solute carrier family 34 (sodium-dependent phosphate cotransporter)
MEKAKEENSLILNLFYLAGILFVFLLGLKLMTVSFESFGSNATKTLIAEYTVNPFVSLFIGMFATALTQSSSLTTSVVVGLVATGQFDDISVAVPVIIGANIGTSVTSTIVSLGHIRNINEFHKAISAGTLHDFFNLIVTVIILPLEIAFGVLSKSAIFLYHIFFTGAEMGSNIEKASFNPISGSLKFISYHILEFTNGYLALIFAFILLFAGLKYLSTVLKSIFIGNEKAAFEKKIFGSKIKSLMWGAGLTAAVQSSSITTSLTVPLVATNVVSIQRAFPFLLGANVGTTATALIASSATPNEASISIAFCHLIYNVTGVLIFMSFPFFQRMAIFLAESLGKLVLKGRWYGFAYVALVFFLLPVLLIVLGK